MWWTSSSRTSKNLRLLGWPLLLQKPIPNPMHCCISMLGRLFVRYFVSEPRNNLLTHFPCLGLNPPVSSITRTTKRQHNFQNHVQLSVGQPVYCNIINANRDVSLLSFLTQRRRLTNLSLSSLLQVTVFGKNADKPNYDSSHYGILGIPENGYCF